MHTANPERDPVREDRMLSLLEALHAIRSPELDQILEEVAAQVAHTFRADVCRQRLHLSARRDEPCRTRHECNAHGAAAACAWP